MSLRQRQHQKATPQFEQAIEEGYAPAEVWNDLGYSYLLDGDGPAAQRTLDRTLELDPGLQAGYHNRAMVDLLRVQKHPGQVPGPDCPTSARRSNSAPARPSCNRDAATLYALAGQQETALDYLRQAVEHGSTQGK